MSAARGHGVSQLSEYLLNRWTCLPAQRAMMFLSLSVLQRDDGAWTCSCEADTGTFCTTCTCCARSQDDMCAGGTVLYRVRDLLKQCSCSFRAQPGRWLLDEGESTDQSDAEMAAELVREQMFRYLHQEVPYALQVRQAGDAFAASVRELDPVAVVAGLVWLAALVAAQLAAP